MKVSDCCRAGWINADGWPTCDGCDRVCVLVEPRRDVHTNTPEDAAQYDRNLEDAA